MVHYTHLLTSRLLDFKRRKHNLVRSPIKLTRYYLIKTTNQVTFSMTKTTKIFHVFLIKCTVIAHIKAHIMSTNIRHLSLCYEHNDELV